MQVAVHEALARRILDGLGDRLESPAILDGAVAPNRTSTWPRPHHRNRTADAILARCARTARRHFMEGRHDRAAFHLGVASHYALDCMVPHAAPGRDHTYCESRFAAIDREMRYEPKPKAGLTDGRAAERAIREIMRVGAATPLNFERRLQTVYSAVMRIGYAVTEEPEPLEVIQELADAFVEMTTLVETQLQDYRERADAAFAERVHDRWDWRRGEAAVRPPGPTLRRALGTCECLATTGGEPGALTAALGRLCLRRFRRAAEAALEKALGSEGDARQLRAHARKAAARYEQVVAGIRARRTYWDWFHVQWDFWEEKGQLAVKYALSEARKARERLVEPETQAFRALCEDAVAAAP